MTRSLPGTPDLQLKAPSGWAGRLQSVATKVGVKVIPWVPTLAVRLLAGGRSVTIDGNTLDPTLQLFLSGQRALGIEGLAVGNDVVASRALMRETCLGFAGPQVHVGVSDLSIPGPAGQIPARHYRPATAEPSPLLVFYHGGGWTIGDLDTHDALCRLTCRDADVHVLMMLAQAASFDPDPSQPLGVRLPVTLDTCEIVPERWANWLAWDPLTLVETRGEGMKRLKGLTVDCGDIDQYNLVYGARRMHRALERLGVTHTYEEFPDDHSSVDYRMDVSLPFLAKALS